jgi:Icc protein
MTSRFLHISDTHLGPDRAHELYGVNTYRAAAALVDALNDVPAEASFVIHTGDIVAHPSEEAYRLAAEVFSRLRLPVYYVSGNHDSSAMIRAFLAQGPSTLQPAGTDRLSYAFDHARHRFLVLDARGPDEIDPHGILGDDQLDLLSRALSDTRGLLTVFLHFPALPVDSLWMDEEMLLLNGGRLHDLLRPAASRVRGVFYGHVHRGTAVWRDGILYASVGSSFRQFSFWPSSTRVSFDPAPHSCFNLVSISETGVSVRHHSIPLGGG